MPLPAKPNGVPNGAAPTPNGLFSPETPQLTDSLLRPLSNSTGPGDVKLNVPASPAPQTAFWPVPSIGWLAVIIGLTIVPPVCTPRPESGKPLTLEAPAPHAKVAETTDATVPLDGIACGDADTSSSPMVAGATV